MLRHIAIRTSAPIDFTVLTEVCTISGLRSSSAAASTASTRREVSSAISNVGTQDLTSRPVASLDAAFPGASTSTQKVESVGPRFADDLSWVPTGVSNDDYDFRAEIEGNPAELSEETVREMALGALANSRARLSMAITGVAGPSGGTPAKPVGTVCLAWAVRDGPLRSETRHFAGDRESVRRQSVIRALEGLLELLTGAVPGHT